MSKYEFLFFKVGRSDVGTNGQTDRQMKNRSEHDSKILEAQKRKERDKEQLEAFVCMCGQGVCGVGVCGVWGVCVCVVVVIEQLSTCLKKFYSVCMCYVEADL